jgi:hypothetical protein
MACVGLLMSGVIEDLTLATIYSIGLYPHDPIEACQVSLFQLTIYRHEQN